MNVHAQTETAVRRKTAKLLIFDLDHTVWDGILLEDGEVVLKPGVRALIETLDARGILMSIASRNEMAPAMEKLEDLGLAKYFIHPQINWGPKSASVKAVVDAINIGIDTVAFVDDQPFEREEVTFALPEVRCFDAEEIGMLAGLPDFTPEVITSESRLRRQMYQSDIKRAEAEEQSGGAAEAFLATLGMTFTIAEATTADLARAEELTLRTNQLNTTGRTYSYAELEALCNDPRYLVLVARLEDKYGPYGTIGLTLIERRPDVLAIQLLLMSCRVMSRGVGSIMINYLRKRAKAEGLRLEADFISNDRNRMMLATYKFSGFKEITRDGTQTLLGCDLDLPVTYPDYVALHLPEAVSC